MEEIILRQTVAQEKIAKEFSRFNNNLEETMSLIKSLGPLLQQVGPLLALMGQKEE